VKDFSVKYLHREYSKESFSARNIGDICKVEDYAGSVVLKNFIDKLFISKVMNKVMIDGWRYFYGAK